MSVLPLQAREQLLFLQCVACSRHCGRVIGLPPPGNSDLSEVTALSLSSPPDRNLFGFSVSLPGTECMDTTQIATDHDFRPTPHPGLFQQLAAKHSTKKAETHSGSGRWLSELTEAP